MAEKVNTTHKVVKRKTKKPRRKFIAVDVWKSEFGPTSVRAVFDVYSTLFKIEQYNMKNHSFSKCVNALRRSEDPTYENPKDIGYDDIVKVN
jgi:hypothetical protein